MAGNADRDWLGLLSDKARIRIPDVERFLHSIAGCLLFRVYGNLVAEIFGALMKLNVSVSGRSLLTPSFADSG